MTKRQNVAPAPQESPSEAEQGTQALHTTANLAVVPAAPVTLMDSIQAAVRQNASMETIERLWRLQQEWEATQAKKAFVTAMNAFKADPPEIIKNRRVAYKDVAYTYATLDNVCDQVTGALSQHGISHRWKIDQNQGVIRVTCILTHDMGHSVETSLEGLADTTGSKNAIQAIGSTVKYLQRYTLLAATGLEAGNEDNDGQGDPPMEALQMHLDRITAAENTTMLQRAYNDAYKAAVASKNTQAMLAIVKCKDAKKDELNKTEPAA